MIVHSYLFGAIDIDEQQVIRFESGIPGFEHLKRFAVIREADDSAFVHLQSVEDGEVTFVLTNPFLFYKDFEFVLSKANQEELKIGNKEDVVVWVIVTVGEDVENTTLNLLAPVVMNPKERLGKQIVLQNTNYKTKHPLIEQTEPAARKR